MINKERKRNKQLTKKTKKKKKKKKKPTVLRTSLAQFTHSQQSRILVKNVTILSIQPCLGTGSTNQNQKAMNSI